MEIKELKNELEQKFNEYGNYSYIKGCGQYSNCNIRWIRLNLNEQTKSKLKSDYKDVAALHIMPYRINVEDIKCAICKYNNDEKIKRYGYKEFNKIIQINSKFVDYDDITGNIHKNSDFDYQIVCVNQNNKNKQFGPMWKEKINRELTLKNIKVNWYFPRIDSNDSTIESTQNIMKLLKNVLDEILEK